VKNSKYELALKYSKSAIKLHERGNIPPYPKFYELFYTYTCGTHPALNEKLNVIFAKGDNPSAEIVEALYEEFLNPNDVEEKLANVANNMSDQISSVNVSIDSAISNADDYSSILQTAVSGLSSSPDKKSLDAFVKTIIDKTKDMQSANIKLEKKLASAKNDVTSLKSKIDDVRRDAMLDPLTKINNRKSFDSSIKTSISHAEESGEPLSLLMIDIDRFKLFNDNHGHQTGDQVLRLVAATLSAGVRDTDLTARYGGEEFVIILPESKLKDSVNVANKLRIAVEKRKLHKRSTDEDLGRITISIGVASFREEDSCETLIERADMALYAAKHAGRNQVVDENSKLLRKTAA
jgi:diguanylate cyclase